MKYIYLIILITSLSLSFSSCTERIDVELSETYTRLIVEGNLSSDTTAHLFKLSKSADYFANEPAPIVSGAQIRLTDNLGNQILLQEKAGGLYQTPSDYYGESNKTYELQINLAQDISGETQYIAETALPTVTPIDSIGLQFNKNFGKDGFWIIQLYAQDPADEVNFYMFNVYKNGALLSDTLDKVSFTDDRMFNGNYTNGIGIMYLRNNKTNEFNIGDTLLLQMSGITESFFTYTEEINRATSFQNPMFGGPPANVKGNLDNGAFGFFSAYSNTYSRMIITEDNVEYVE
ncbi:MAG: hypothetical protein B7C24_00125 [Bacteroidetes bacterium 4572_77]|nr:MAG: hypothetical protein B7C24_00125 [Bacteroidetes bacterium 4572_77]